jgi:ketosteroid isomerase-like protein
MPSEHLESKQGEVEVAKAAADAFSRAVTDGEIEAFLPFLAQEIDFKLPSAMQDAVMRLNGHDEVRGYLRQTAEEYEELHLEWKEIRECGGGRYLMLGSWQATVRKTQTRFGTPMGLVFDMRDGEVTRLRAFFDEQLAIDAAGRD